MTDFCCRARRLFAPASLAVLLLLPQIASAWWNDDWSFRKRIDIDLTAANLTAAQAEVPELVRLHVGNFAYFLDAQPDGSDLRFLAADDRTPLTFHVEQFDGLAGVAAIWVKIPRLDHAESQSYFWMYYGNDAAESASDPAGTWDVQQTAAFHFDENAGLPKDATAFGHDAASSSARAGGSGLIDTGLQFDDTQSMRIEPTPALAIDPQRGNTISFWLRPDGRSDDALIFSQARGQRALRIGIRDLSLFVEAGERAEDGTADALTVDQSLTINNWHFVVLTIGANGMTLRLDGNVVATGALTPGELNGPIFIGASDARPGFRGVIDELRFSSSVRPDAWLDLQAALQAQDSQVVLPGEDESRDKAGGAAEYLGLLWALLGAVRLEGWIIIGLLVLMGLLSLDVMINKSALLKKLERGDADFLKRYEAATAAGAELEPAEEKHSPLGSLHRAAVSEWQSLKALNAQGDGRMPPEALEAVRSAMDVEMVEQSGRMTSRLVLMTIAVSGGPFLGLLGTVVGVMITFATIAAAGDVNVNTIAPGVSAALTTTVMGLLVAIPALFGYNYLTTKIQRITTAMEVFSDRLVTRMALASVRGAMTEDVSRAA